MSNFPNYELIGHLKDNATVRFDRQFVKQQLLKIK